MWPKVHFNPSSAENTRLRNEADAQTSANKPRTAPLPLIRKPEDAAEMSASEFESLEKALEAHLPEAELKEVKRILFGAETR